jgi:GT2 family glycosyltransferase
MIETVHCSPQKEPAPVTVVVVNCNGGVQTLKCLRSLAASDPRPDRVVLVDNGSTDGTRELIQREYRDPLPLTTIWAQRNLGPAAARNLGAGQVTTPFIAFLDNDTVVHPTWLQGALGAMAAHRADCAQCKLLLYNDSTRIDSLGYLLGPFGFPRHIVRPGAPDLPEYQHPRLLFGVKSAAMVISRLAFETVGGFDPMFFIYGEETDLCWRLIRSGGRIVLAPESIVLHDSGGTRRFLPGEAETLLYRIGTRNYFRMVAKNSPSLRLLPNIVGQIALWSAVAGLQTIRGRFGSARLILLGVWDGLVMMPVVIRARRKSALPYLEMPRELRMGFNVNYLWRLVRAV